MRNKIKEALKQGHKKLGVSDEVFERVAASVETFITDESQIEGFVTSDATLNLLKSYQSMADKLRDHERRVKAQGDNAGEKAVQTPATDTTQQPTETQTQDIGKIVAEAVATAIKPISDELTQFKGEQAVKAAMASAEATFKGNAYVKKYGDEADYAWERATELYEATGKKWSSEQLNEKAMGYFTKAVSRKGVDTSKPFKGDGGASETEADFSSFDRAAKKLGWVKPEK